MKKTIKICTAILILSVLTNTLKAQNQVNTAVGAKIVEAISISEIAPMHFGTMTSPATAATVTVTPAGARSSTGTITLLAQAPSASAGGFTVTGSSDATYAITLPTSVTISNGNIADDMVVNAFTCSYPTLVSTISMFGSDVFFLGAKLNLASAQNSGEYVGTFNVSVAYN